VIQIQDEYDKILLDGSQSVRILNTLSDAEIELPDLKWTPIKTEIKPGEKAIKMLEMDWSMSSFEFRRQLFLPFFSKKLFESTFSIPDLLQLYNGLLDILKAEFHATFDQIRGNSLKLPREHLLLHALLTRIIGTRLWNELFAQWGFNFANFHSFPDIRRIRESISNEKMGENHSREETISIPLRMTEDMLKETMEKCQLSGTLQIN
jgi:hypothetical protein